MGATRAAADPYAEFVRKREAERAADRLRRQLAGNPAATWENLRSWDPSQAA